MKKVFVYLLGILISMYIFSNCSQTEKPQEINFNIPMSLYFDVKNEIKLTQSHSLDGTKNTSTTLIKDGLAKLSITQFGSYNFVFSQKLNDKEVKEVYLDFDYNGNRNLKMVREFETNIVNKEY